MAATTTSRRLYDPAYRDLVRHGLDPRRARRTLGDPPAQWQGPRRGWHGRPHGRSRGVRPALRPGEQHLDRDGRPHRGSRRPLGDAPARRSGPRRGRRDRSRWRHRPCVRRALRPRRGNVVVDRRHVRAPVRARRAPARRPGPRCRGHHGVRQSRRLAGPVVRRDLRPGRRHVDGRRAPVRGSLRPHRDDVGRRPGSRRLRQPRLRRTAFQTAEVYDPVLGTWTPAPGAIEPHYGHTATLLNDGTVLIVGGYRARRRVRISRALRPRRQERGGQPSPRSGRARATRRRCSPMGGCSSRAAGPGVEAPLESRDLRPGKRVLTCAATALRCSPSRRPSSPSCSWRRARPQPARRRARRPRRRRHPWRRRSPLPHCRAHSRQRRRHCRPFRRRAACPSTARRGRSA